jgi:hypothetical protein
MSKDIEFDSRKKIFEEVKKFSRAEQEELYRILRRNGEDMSENRNGIFFDLMSLSEKTIVNIQEWISFCNNNRESFEVREKEMNTLLQENPRAREGEA